MAKDVQVIREPAEPDDPMATVAFTMRLPRWMHEELRAAVYERKGKSMNDLLTQGAVMRLRMQPRTPWEQVMAQLGYDAESGRDTRGAA